MIINGSPRAPKSNSKEYALIFSKYCNIDSDYYNLSKSNHQELCRRMEEYSDVLFVFPLYADPSGRPSQLSEVYGSKSSGKQTGSFRID